MTQSKMPLGTAVRDRDGDRCAIILHDPLTYFDFDMEEVFQTPLALLTKIRGEKRWSVLPVVVREGVQYQELRQGHRQLSPKPSASWPFFCLLSADRRKLHILAGCRHFTSFRAARAYWSTRETRFVDDAAASKTLDERSLAILDGFEKKVKRLRARHRAKQEPAKRPARKSYTGRRR